MKLWLVKVLILLVLFIATYCFSLLPIKLMSIARSATDQRKRARIERIISFLSCFAAGVFLATCLLDLFPDVQNNLDTAKKAYGLTGTTYSDYPAGASIMVIGFFLVLIVEQTVLAVKENHENVRELVYTGSRGRSKNRTNYGSLTQTDGHENHTDGECDCVLPEETVYRQRSASVTSARSISGIHDMNNQVEHSVHEDPNSHSPLRSFIMLIALSLHSVFEGLAVGLEETVNGVVSLFGALIIHKCIIAFSIGLNLVQSRLTFWTLIRSNAVFCVASPFGVAIGILIDLYSNKDADALASGILQGLACGTFLYVTFFEVLPHEFNKPRDRLLKLLFVVIGYIFVNGVLFLEMATAVSKS